MSEEFEKVETEYCNLNKQDVSWNQLRREIEPFHHPLKQTALDLTRVLEEEGYKPPHQWGISYVDMHIWFRWIHKDPLAMQHDILIKEEGRGEEVYVYRDVVYWNKEGFFEET